jgi:ArsR family transcriptional regulator, arsenate/arsenite/antimonite-responsive transcriptional repressor
VASRPDAAEVGAAPEFWCISISDAPLSQERAVEAAKVFTALADPVRLRLLSLVASKGEVCSCDLEKPLARTQPTVSHHTRVLAEAGLLLGERRGRWTFWRVSDQRLADIRALLGAATVSEETDAEASADAGYHLTA